MPETAEVVEGDELEQYIMFSTSHDGSGSIKVYPTSVRTVCQNTYRASLRGRRGGISMRHTGNVKKNIASARRALGLAGRAFELFNVTARELAAKRMEDPRPLFNAVLDEVCDTKIADTPVTRESIDSGALARAIGGLSIGPEREAAQVGDTVEALGLIERRKRSYELHRLGQSIDDIGRALGVDPKTAWNDIVWVQRKVLGTSAMAGNETTGRLFADLELTKTEAIRGWVRSQGGKRKRVRRRKGVSGGDSRPEVDEGEEVTDERQSSPGDPRFLAAFESATWKQAILLGLVEDGKRGRLKPKDEAEKRREDTVVIVEVTTREEAAKVRGKRFFRLTDESGRQPSTESPDGSPDK